MLKTVSLVIVAFVACTPQSSATKDDAGALPVAKAAPAPPPEPPKKTVEQQVAESVTLAAALSFAQPKMEDTANKMDDGTVMLTRWAAKNLRWVDVAVATNETSFALVMKDSDEARGKKLCASGSIITIELVKTDVGKLFDALFHDYAGNIYQLYAAGSSGDLVERSQSRFCGVVTGKYDYSNSGGGTGHAIKVVGMFDLPANKAARPVAATP
ncbi:MAG: hypothetical protein JWM82_2103 [Myxococcales bacterium]|nr:hypothetical protein [Myxococcales bacterium]